MRKLLLLACICLITTILSSSQLIAQNEINTKSLQLRTPRDAAYIHLSYLQADNFEPEIAAKALDVKDPDSEDAMSLAVMLKKFYDGKAFFVDMNSISDDPNFKDSVTSEYKFVVYENYPEIYISRVNGKWKYSQSTLEALPALYKKEFPLAAYDFEDSLPDWLQYRIFSIKLYQYFMIVAFFLISLILYRIFSWIIGYFLIRIFEKIRLPKFASSFVKPTAKPFSFLTVILLNRIFLPTIHLPIDAHHFIQTGLNALLPVAFAMIAYKLVDLVGDILARMAEKTKSTVDDQLVPLAMKTMKVLVVIFSGLYILKSFEVDITPLLAGVSVGGLAFALAAQDMLKNFFGSITIFSDQPFEIGDWIVFDGTEGTVEEIGVRSSRVRTFYNSLISIPNGKLADMTIDNMGRREFRRYSTNISLTYDTPPDLIDAYVEGLKKIVDTHPLTRKDYYQIHLNNFNESSLDVLLYIFFKVPDWTQELEARHDIINAAIRLADDLGVRFAYPTQTLFVEEVPGQKSLTPRYEEKREGFKNKMASYFKSRPTETLFPNLSENPSMDRGDSDSGNSDGDGGK
jgi:MscS family membrane protein